MGGFAGVHILRRRAGGGEGCRDFSRHMAGLSHARHHDPAFRAAKRFHRFYKGTVQRGHQRLQSLDLEREGLPGGGKMAVFCRGAGRAAGQVALLVARRRAASE